MAESGSLTKLLWSIALLGILSGCTDEPHKTCIASHEDTAGTVTITDQNDNEIGVDVPETVCDKWSSEPNDHQQSSNN